MSRPCPCGDDRPLTPAEVAQIERALATPGFWGPVLPPVCDTPHIGHSVTESDRGSE